MTVHFPHAFADLTTDIYDSIFTSGMAIGTTGPSLYWIMQDTCEPVVLNIKNNNMGEEVVSLKEQFSGVFFSSNSAVTLIKGQLRVRDLNFLRFSKLQAFIDAGKKYSAEARQDTVQYGFKELNSKVPLNSQSFENWYLQQNIYKPQNSEDIAAVLRNHESYHLVHYLLSQLNSHKTLIELGGKYGLSVAHFRRLSKAALGKAVKVEMSNWRMIRAVLDMIESETNITMVAFKHGYSSLSHFSSAVKDTFNKPPKELIKIIKNGR